jgi:hypothetical protein
MNKKVVIGISVSVAIIIVIIGVVLAVVLKKTEPAANDTTATASDKPAVASDKPAADKPIVIIGGAPLPAPNLNYSYEPADSVPDNQKKLKVYSKCNFEGTVKEYGMGETVSVDGVLDTSQNSFILPAGTTVYVYDSATDRATNYYLISHNILGNFKVDCVPTPSGSVKKAIKLDLLSKSIPILSGPFPVNPQKLVAIYSDTQMKGSIIELGVGEHTSASAPFSVVNSLNIPPRHRVILYQNNDKSGPSETHENAFDYAKPVNSIKLGSVSAISVNII